MKEQWFQQERTYGNPHGLYFEASHQPGFEARLAIDIIRSWTLGGMYRDRDADSVCLLSATELAKRACDVAQAMTSEFKQRDWLEAVQVVPNDRR